MCIYIHYIIGTQKHYAYDNLLTRKKLSKEPFSMYSVTIITGLPKRKINDKYTYASTCLIGLNHRTYLYNTL